MALKQQLTLGWQSSQARSYGDLGNLRNLGKRVCVVRCVGENPNPGKLELELRRAIEAEDYSRAADLRDKLRIVREDVVGEVVEANARFYRAFERGDLAEMRRVWAEGEDVQCVHPGAGRICGYEMVMSSWEVMLGPEADLPLKIELEDVEVRVKVDLGYVSCVEVVRAGSSWGKQIATNVFEKKDGVWRICMHHASHTRT